MTVLAGAPQAGRAAGAGRWAGERDQLGRIPRDLWQALAAIEAASVAGIPGAQQVLF